MDWRRTTNSQEAPTEQELSEMALELNLRLFCDLPAEGALAGERLLWVDGVSAEALPPAGAKRGGLLAALLRLIRWLLHWKK